MKLISSLIKTLSYSLLLAGTCVLHAQENTLTFGTSGNATDVVPNGNNTATLEMTGDALTIQGDNFWTIQAMVPGLAFDLLEIDDTKTLELEISGYVQDIEPKIRVVLFTNNWEKFEYLVDLSEMDSTETKKFKATTPLSQPVPEKGSLEEATAPFAGIAIARVLFIPEAKEGNRPWELQIKSLAVVDSDE